MNDFTASNGIPVKVTNDGRLIVENADHTYPATIAAGDHVEALREFFQAERDEALGRWRWPEDPDFAVYRQTPSRVRVLRESVGKSFEYLRQELGSVPSAYGSAAIAHFDAHPEPKPWHDAKPGEVWLLNVAHKNADDEVAWQVAISCEFSRLGLALNRRDERITAGRRIWPEVS